MLISWLRRCLGERHAIQGVGLGLLVRRGSACARCLGLGLDSWLALRKAAAADAERAMLAFMTGRSAAFKLRLSVWLVLCLRAMASFACFSFAGCSRASGRVP